MQKNTVTIDQEDEPAKEEEEETSDRPKDLSYTFHASRLPTARQVMYQLCDIYDDDVKRIVAENDGKVFSKFFILSQNLQRLLCNRSNTPRTLHIWYRLLLQMKTLHCNHLTSSL